MNKIAVLFSGQGAQCVGMGYDLYSESASAKALYDMGEKLCPGILHICFEGEAHELMQTEHAQPCLLLTGLAFANELKAAGLPISASAGFSLGEIPALAFSGILSDEDAFRLVLARAKKMAELSKKYPGGMAAVLKMDTQAVEAACDEFSEIWPVNYNCPGQLSCAGSAEQIDDFINRIKALGGRAVKLSVSGAFHTPYMKDAASLLREQFNNMSVSSPNIPLYSNRTGTLYPSDKEAIADTVAAQVCSPVKWEQLLRQMDQDGINTFIEVGAGSTLTGFVKRTLPAANVYTVNNLTMLQETIAALRKDEI